ncbi:MAG: sensor histidine kinase [Rhodocyclaceae bacterium]
MTTRCSQHHLSHRLLRGVLLVAGGASLLFGALFLGLYREQLEAERAEASLHVNRTLQAAWENAMLKRDIPGLRDIVGRLGELPGIRDVMILAPNGEVRFASDRTKLGSLLPAVAGATTAGKPISRFEMLEGGKEVLRSINPVPNREPCKPCHGPAASHPVNGVLVIDYDAAPIRASARSSAVALLAAGALVLGLMLITLWFLLRRHVIRPLMVLDEVTQAFSEGQLTKRAPLVGDDEIGRLASSFNQMAERLEAQMAQLARHEAYLQQILDGLPDGVRVIRVADMRVVLANRAFCQQVGLSAAAVLEHPCYQTSHGRSEPCTPTMTLCPLVELKEVGATLKARHRHQRADGRPFPAEVHAVLVEIGDDADKTRYLVESIRDLGESVRISQEQRLSELGLLAAGIAHEIHNPLGSVRLGVQGLAREIRSARVTPEQIAEYMTLIDQEIDNCIAVTRRLLLLARPPDNSLNLVILNDALADTLQLLDYDAQTHGIVQHLELPDTSLRVLANEADMRMIFLNLIQNAHHAMPSGGHLNARLAAADGWAVIEIADTGVGMAPETVARIFDPFFSQRADHVKGTGLGLTIVKSIVERMQGTISVESTPGQGTRFTIRLPLAERAMEQGQ